MFHKDTRRARRAFTLVEMMTVMGIMLLLATIVVIAVAPFLKGRSLASGAGVVQAAIYQARAYASTQRTRATVYFDPEEGTVAVHATPYIVAGNRVDQPEHLPAGVRFMLFEDPDGRDVVVTDTGDPPTGIGNILVFSPLGSLDPLYGTGNRSVRLTDAAGINVKHITVVFASGMMKLKDESK